MGGSGHIFSLEDKNFEMTNTEIIKSVRKTLNVAYKSIQKQSKNLPMILPEVARVISESKGKIIFCGVGKSGHICRKLSSTLSLSLIHI